MRPTTITFGTVIKAWAKSGSIKLAQKAEDLLRRVLTLRDDHGWDHLQVNTILYTSVLSAYARAGDPESAERLLREMFQEFVGGNQDVQPNIYSINTVLFGWSKSSLPTAFESVEVLFRSIDNLLESGAIVEEPDAVTYNNLLSTLARTRQVPVDAVAKAEDLVVEMQEEALRPTIHTFKSLLRILASKNDSERDVKIEYWLSEARKLKIRDYRSLEEQFLRGEKERRPTNARERRSPQRKERKSRIQYKYYVK